MKVVAVGPDTRIPGSLNAAPKTVLLLEFQRIHDGLETVDYYPNVFENFSTRLVTENGSQADLNLWDTKANRDMSVLDLFLIPIRMSSCYAFP